MLCDYAGHRRRDAVAGTDPFGLMFGGYGAI